MTATLDALPPSDGPAFELLAKRLLETMGLKNVTLNGPTNSSDGGVDLRAEQHNLRGEVVTLYLVQCKNYTSDISAPMIRDLRGAEGGRDSIHGIPFERVFMTTSRFTEPANATAAASGARPIILWDREKISQLIEDHDLDGVNNYDAVETRCRVLESDCDDLNLQLEQRERLLEHATLEISKSKVYSSSLERRIRELKTEVMIEFRQELTNRSLDTLLEEFPEFKDAVYIIAKDPSVNAELSHDKLFSLLKDFPEWRMALLELDANYRVLASRAQRKKPWYRWLNYDRS